MKALKQNGNAIFRCITETVAGIPWIAEAVFDLVTLSVSRKNDRSAKA